jgi:iodothyronine deiodinase-like protein
MESNQLQNFVFNQPKVFAERKKAAGILVDRLKYRMPLAIDTMDNRTDKAYAAWPERIYILGTDGKVLFKGDVGPFGFHPEEAEKALAAIVPARAAAAR